MNVRLPRLILMVPWIAVGLAVALLAAQYVRPPAPKEFSARWSASALLSAPDVAGFQRAEQLRAFSFPADHGPHDGFRIEWWYFTGNLDDEGGQRFGYELTFFRTALSPQAEEGRTSHLATNHAWMAHFAVTDVADGKFRCFERFDREALGLAGASVRPWGVNVGPWSVKALTSSAATLHLEAKQGELALELDLLPTNPPVLHGDHGLSRKSAEPGNASYYYSVTRITTTGTLRIGTRTFRVNGSSWMDREWSSGALTSEQEGWDWFALELSDGRELMLYRLRHKDGSADPFSGGSLIAANGSVTPLSADDVSIDVRARWTSPTTGVEYPSRWRIASLRHELALEIEPVLAGQELDTTVRYWEGAVDVHGNSGGTSVTGRGYVELVGYGEGKQAH